MVALCSFLCYCLILFEKTLWNFFASRFSMNNVKIGDFLKTLHTFSDCTTSSSRPFRTKRDLTVRNQEHNYSRPLISNFFFWKWIFSLPLAYLQYKVQADCLEKHILFYHYPNKKKAWMACFENHYVRAPGVPVCSSAPFPHKCCMLHNWSNVWLENNCHRFRLDRELSRYRKNPCFCP